MQAIPTMDRLHVFPREIEPGAEDLGGVECNLTGEHEIPACPADEFACCAAASGHEDLARMLLVSARPKPEPDFATTVDPPGTGPAKAAIRCSRGWRCGPDTEAHAE